MLQRGFGMLESEIAPISEASQTRDRMRGRLVITAQAPAAGRYKVQYLVKGRSTYH